MLALRDPADVKGRSLARLHLAQAYVQDHAVEEACAAVIDALAIRHENRVGPILRRAREVHASLEPWRDGQPVRELDEQLRPLLPRRGRRLASAPVEPKGRPSSKLPAAYKRP